MWTWHIVALPGTPAEAQPPETAQSTSSNFIREFLSGVLLCTKESAYVSVFMYLEAKPWSCLHRASLSVSDASPGAGPWLESLADSPPAPTQNTNMLTKVAISTSCLCFGVKVMHKAFHHKHSSYSKLKYSQWSFLWCVSTSFEMYVYLALLCFIGVSTVSERCFSLIL